MIFNKKDKEFKFEPKIFNSIDCTRNDSAIQNIKINVKDDFDNSNSVEMNIDFDRYIKMPKFNAIETLSNISITAPEYDDTYQTIDINPFIDIMQPFTYTSINHRNGERYKRISRLTPSSEWPKIDFNTEQKINYRNGE